MHISDLFKEQFSTIVVEKKDIWSLYACHFMKTQHTPRRRDTSGRHKTAKTRRSNEKTGPARDNNSQQQRPPCYRADSKPPHQGKQLLPRQQSKVSSSSRLLSEIGDRRSRKPSKPSKKRIWNYLICSCVCLAWPPRRKESQRATHFSFIFILLAPTEPNSTQPNPT